MSNETTAQKLDRLLENLEALDKRMTLLENDIRSGKGFFVGVAAVVGFLLANGLGKIKELLGIA